MKVVIAGCGDIGEALARHLKERGDEVVVLDRDDRVCERLSRMGIKAVKGDVTDPHLISEVGVAEADVFLALTGSDDVNLVSAILAKHHGAKRVIVRVENPVYAEACRMVGLTELCSPAEATALRIDAAIHGFKLADIITLGERYVDVEHLEVEEGSELAWIKVKAAQGKLPKDCYLAFVASRDGGVKLPDPNLTLEPGDVLVLIRRRRG